MQSFRGKEGQSFKALKAKYSKSSKTTFSSSISKALSFVNDWTIDLRYEPGDTPSEDVEKFLSSAEAILNWSKARL